MADGGTKCVTTEPRQARFDSPYRTVNKTMRNNKSLVLLLTFAPYTEAEGLIRQCKLTSGAGLTREAAIRTFTPGGDIWEEAERLQGKPNPMSMYEASETLIATINSMEDGEIRALPVTGKNLQMVAIVPFELIPESMREERQLTEADVEREIARILGL